VNDATLALTVREGARRAAGLAREIGLDQVADAIVQGVEQRLDSDRLRVAILGEVNHGKSSLLNALVGKALLPVAVTPTTAAVIAVAHGTADEITVTDPQHTTRPLAPEELVAVARGAMQIEGSVEVTTPGAPRGLLLVDTPGMNELGNLRDRTSRGELPRADVLVIVLDATQLLTRTELSFLREGLRAIGGLGSSGAHLLVAVNRADLVPREEHATLRAHLTATLAGVVRDDDVYFTDARAATKDPAGAASGVAEVRRLRARLMALAEDRVALLPARARAGLLRHLDLLRHHGSIHARALETTAAAIGSELEVVRHAHTHERRDAETLRAMLHEGAEVILGASRRRRELFREELEISALALASQASLRVLGQHLPGSVHDACVVFAEREAALLREELDELARRALHTHGRMAEERLIHAMLRVGSHGPTVFVDPPSLGLEASAVAVGLVGTAIMYFGSLVTGMVMTVAGPLATVLIRERSVRRARDRVRRLLPDALQTATAAMGAQIEAVVHEQVAAVEEHLELADAALGRQLVEVLEHARSSLGALEARPGDARPAARAAAQQWRERLAAVRRDLELSFAETLASPRTSAAAP
jgi:ribosome biogenesis GTPase A